MTPHGRHELRGGSWAARAGWYVVATRARQVRVRATADAVSEPAEGGTHAGRAERGDGTPRLRPEHGGPGRDAGLATKFAKGVPFRLPPEVRKPRWRAGGTAPGAAHAREVPCPNRSRVHRTSPRGARAGPRYPRGRLGGLGWHRAQNPGGARARPCRPPNPPGGFQSNLGQDRTELGGLVHGAAPAARTPRGVEFESPAGQDTAGSPRGGAPGANMPRGVYFASGRRHGRRARDTTPATRCPRGVHIVRNDLFLRRGPPSRAARANAARRWHPAAAAATRVAGAQRCASHDARLGGFRASRGGMSAKAGPVGRGVERQVPGSGAGTGG